MLNDRGTVDMVAIIGMMVGFLVVGVIGIYVGDQMLMAANQSISSNPQLHTAQINIVQTFELGVTLCKVIIIVAVAAIVFVLLQQTGVIPSMGDRPTSSYQSSYQSVQTPVRSQSVNNQPPRSQPTVPPASVSVPVPVSAHNTESRWETLDVAIESDKDEKGSL